MQPISMVPAPKPPSGRKPRSAPRKSPVKEGSQKPRSQQGRPEDNPHFVQITVVAPSCAQRVYWTGRDWGWPLSSKHACMNCCHTFKGPPVGLPVHYDERTDMFRLWGNYCSFNCCKRYIMDTRRSDTSHLIDNMALLCIKVHRQNVRLRAAPKHYKGIITAPPKTALEMFGGGLTIEEFRKNSVRITDVLAKEPFVKMSWPDAVLAVKGNSVHNLQANAAEKSAAAKPFAVGRAAPLRKNNTLDAFLKG